QLVEDERGGGAVKEEIIPFDSRADEARGRDLHMGRPRGFQRDAGHAPLHIVAYRRQPTSIGCRSSQTQLVPFCGSWQHHPVAAPAAWAPKDRCDRSVSRHHALWIGSIQGTCSGFSAGSMSRLTTTASLSLRTSTHSSGSFVLALIS